MLDGNVTRSDSRTVLPSDSWLPVLAIVADCPDELLFQPETQSSAGLLAGVVERDGSANTL